MRVTNSMMVSQFLSDANSGLSRVAKSQEKVNTSKKISNIADDPLATIASLKARNRLSSLSNYQASLVTAKSYLTEAESATSDINGVLQSAYDLIVTANSGSKGPDEMRAISGEVANLRDELLSIANSSIGTSYLFGGNTTTNAPFSVDEVGRMFYNGINMSGMALNEECSVAGADLLEDAAKVDGLIQELDDASTYHAQHNVCVSIGEQLSKMCVAAQVALESAAEFHGVDTAHLDEQADFPELAGIKGLNELKTRISDIKARLENEMAQPIVPNTSGLTPEEAQNSFRIEDCQAILNDFKAMTQADPGTGKSQVETWVEEGKKAFPADLGDNVAGEAAVSTKLKVGSTTYIEVTANGLELLGTGASNFYCLLDKCTKILDGDLDKSLLGGMVGELQNAMSENITLRTQFGSSLERINMISDRFTTSEISYTEMKSDAEDADLADAIVNWKTAQTVYDAALAAGSKIIQTSLLDFLS